MFLRFSGLYQDSHACVNKETIKTDTTTMIKIIKGIKKTFFIPAFLNILAQDQSTVLY